MAKSPWRKRNCWKRCMGKMPFPIDIRAIPE
jgi:hypothetical protein